jgi:hypothetical protein
MLHETTRPGHKHLRRPRRCSDKASADFYIKSVRHLPADRRIFLTSDEAAVERRFKREFGARLVTRPKSDYPRKLSESRPTWRHNILRSTPSVQEAVVDLYLLAKTDLRVYHPLSTFAAWALVLGGQRQVNELTTLAARGLLG